MEGEAAAWLERLDGTLAHVPEPAMRRRLVREALLELGPEKGYALLGAVLERPCAPAGGDALRESIHAVLLSGDEAEGLPYELRSALYASARRAGDERAMRVLRSLPPREVLEDPGRLLPRELQDIPLGRRRSLARGGDARLLEQLARDCDPIVVRHLLRNPRLREDDVLRMAAMRPVAQVTLREIERSPRWAPSWRIRAALARNPYCPVEVAVKLVPGLSLADLREMRRDPDLHPEVSASVADELARRTASRP